MNAFEEWWSNYGHEAYRGFQLEAFKAGMLAAAEIAEQSCLNRIESDNKTTAIIYAAIKAKAEEL